MFVFSEGIMKVVLDFEKTGGMFKNEKCHEGQELTGEVVREVRGGMNVLHRKKNYVPECVSNLRRVID